MLESCCGTGSTLLLHTALHGMLRQLGGLPSMLPLLPDSSSPRACALLLLYLFLLLRATERVIRQTLCCLKVTHYGLRGQ